MNTPTYGASGASLSGFRRKYGGEYTPLPKRHNVSVGTDSRSPSNFELWNARGTDFPTPTKSVKPRVVDPPKMYHSLLVSLLM